MIWDLLTEFIHRYLSHPFREKKLMVRETDVYYVLDSLYRLEEKLWVSSDSFKRIDLPMDVHVAWDDIVSVTNRLRSANITFRMN